MTNLTRRTFRATAVVAMASIGLFGAAGLASADPGSTSAFGLRTEGLVVAGPFATSSCGPGSCTPDNLISANVSGLVTTGALQTTATPSGASSNVFDVDATLGPVTTLTAGQVSSSCTVDSTAGVAGESSIANGEITILGSPPVTLESSPAPNTVVAVPDPAVESVVLNQQTTGPDGTLTVDAIFIRFANGQTITIASSSCTPTEAPTTTTTVAPTTTTSMATTTTSTLAPGGPIQIDDVVVSDGNVARVTGAITCQAGRFGMGVFITQNDTEGRGIVTGNCTGQPQRFRVIVEVTRGPGFEDGAASARAVGRFSTTQGVEIDVQGGMAAAMLQAAADPS